MLFLVATFCCCLPLLIQASSATTYSCNAIRTTIIDTYFGNHNSNTSISLDMKLVKIGNETLISVTNFSYNDTNNSFPDYICANVQFDINETSDPQICSASTLPFNFSIHNPSFYLHAHFPASYWYELYFGYADDSTFSYGDGSFFTQQNPSFSSITNDRNSYIEQTQTCIAFVPAPEIPTKTYPRCKSFKSRTSILNVNDNYSIYTTSSATYNFTYGNNLRAKIDFTGPKDYYILYWINSDNPCESLYTQPCPFPLLNGDGKAIIHAAIVKQSGYETIGNAIPMMGRIIIRGNETLMEEGIPFSQTNNCQYFNYKFGENQVSNNQFCCIEFESI